MRISRQDLSYQRVWLTATKSIPELIALLEKVIPAEQKGYILGLSRKTPPRRDVCRQATGIGGAFLGPSTAQEARHTSAQTPPLKRLRLARGFRYAPAELLSPPLGASLLQEGLNLNLARFIRLRECPQTPQKQNAEEKTGNRK